MNRQESLYDLIGVGYDGYRRPDARISRRISDALGNARTVVNVGAGCGSYEPIDRPVIAVEPSWEMIGQRDPHAASVIRSNAAPLPLRDGSFDAGLAVLTIHHWRDWRWGLSELVRVTHGRVVLLTWDPSHPGFWLIQDYFPEILSLDRVIFPEFLELERVMGPVEIHEVPIPWDCTDGFLGAYWRRPESYLDEGVRGAISTFSKIRSVEAGIERLEEDLKSGQWTARNGALRELEDLDLGYRIVIARAR